MKYKLDTGQERLLRSEQGLGPFTFPSIQPRGGPDFSQFMEKKGRSTQIIPISEVIFTFLLYPLAPL